MKKSLIIVLMIAVALSATFASNFLLSPKVGYDVIRANTEVKDSDPKERQIYSVKGPSAGIELSYLFTPKLSVYGNANFVLPSVTYISSAVDGKKIGEFWNKKAFKDVGDDIKDFGAKLHAGILYDVYYDGVVDLNVGVGLAVSAYSLNFKETGADTKNESLYLSGGLGLKASANYYFNEKIALFGTVEPDVNVFSYAKTKTGDSDSVTSSGIGLSLGFSGAVGCSFAF